MFSRIVLPEGCHDIKVKYPYPIERLEDSLHFTYLDTKGRPVITLHQTNLIEQHIQVFSVTNFVKFLFCLNLLEIQLLFSLLVGLGNKLQFSSSTDASGTASFNSCTLSPVCTCHNLCAPGFLYQ